MKPIGFQISLRMKLWEEFFFFVHFFFFVEDLKNNEEGYDEILIKRLGI